MPRAVGKKKLGFWFSEEERELLKDLAYREGLTQSDLIRSLMIERARKTALEQTKKTKEVKK